MADLLSCPFCGKDAQIAPDEIGSGGQHVPPYHAGCLRGAGCGIAFTADDPDEAIAEWNRRALSTVTPAEVGGLVERLRESAEELPTNSPAAINYREAATALEAQAAELAEARADALKVGDQMLAEKFRAERAEAALAEARKTLGLIDALDPEEHIYSCSHDATRGLVIQMGQIARRALTGGKS